MVRPMSELFTEVICWASTQGARDLPSHDGLWHGSTDEWDVSINGHSEEVDDVPPMSVKLTHRRMMSVALVNPYGGIVAAGNEIDMIDHFREQASARAKGGDA
jgi:hypothetical protein